MSKIGLKLANGEFYPVLDDGSVARKRLVVTTVQDGQKSVQIDIYRGTGPTVAGGEYAGSLVIEKLPFAPKGEPDIRLDLCLDKNGRLSAYAEELSSGEHQSIELSLAALDEENSYEIPDFAFEEERADLPAEVSPNEALAFVAAPEGSGTVESPYSGEEIAGTAYIEEPPRRKKALLVALAAIGLALVLGCAYLVYRFVLTPKTGTAVLTSETAQPAPAPLASSEPPAAPAAETQAFTEPQTAAAAPTTPSPAAQTATTLAATAQPPSPSAQSTVTGPAPKTSGVYYRLRWGDTLWDLSYIYYQTPWLFGKIAKANKIKNPDHIIAGRKIWIPPR